MSFAKILVNWRAQKRFTQAAAVEWLSSALSFDISLRTYQGWEDGHEPHGITRAAIEATLQKPRPS